MSTFTVHVRVKKIGKQKKEHLEPVPYILDARPDTRRDLIAGFVEQGVKAYHERRDENQGSSDFITNPIRGRVVCERSL